MSQPSKTVKALDATGRIVQAGARVLDVVLRKHTIVERVKNVIGEETLAEALDEIESAIDRKLVRPAVERAARKEPHK